MESICFLRRKSKLLKFIFKGFVELTGNRMMSKILVKFTRSKLSKPFIPLFSRVYKINQDEMALSIKDYNSLHEFFTRLLKSDVRIVDQSENTIVSPVDSVVTQFGLIKDVEKLNIKKKDIDLVEMLGSEEKAEKYKNGKYIIFYLSPQHYHRIHSPFEGEIKEIYSLGGKSYPVNKLGLKYGKRPLSTNFRRITELKTDLGDIAIVKVGALNVNSIHITTEKNKVERGEEIAYFSFGSTVILLIENPKLEFSDHITKNQEIKFGEKVLELSK